MRNFIFFVFTVLSLLPFVSWAGIAADKGLGSTSEPLPMPQQKPSAGAHAFISPSIGQTDILQSVSDNVIFLRTEASRVYSLHEAHDEKGEVLKVWQSSAHSMTLLSQFSVGFSPTAMTVVDETLYLGNAQGQLFIMDIQQADKPKILSTYQAQAGIHALSVTQHSVYLQLTNNDMVAVDIDPPTQTRKRYVLNLDQPLLPQDQLAQAFSGDEKHLYFYHGKQIFYAVMNKNGIFTSFSSLTLQSPINHFVVGKRFVYIASAYGITSARITDNGLVWHSHYGKVGAIKRLVMLTDRLAAITNKSTVYAFNMHNDDHLELLTLAKDVPDADAFAALNIKNQLLMVAGKALINLDLSQTMPAYSNEMLDQGQGVNYGGQRKIFIENKRMYVADWFSGLHIYDISHPSTPQILSNLHTPGSSKGVVVQNGLAYIADDDHGLQVADVSDPRSPRIIANLPLQGLAYTPVIDGDRLYMASHRGGFQIIGIKEPEHPVLLGQYDLPGMAWSIKIKQHIAYIADDEAGLLSVDVQDPKNVRLLGQWQAPKQGQKRPRVEDVLIEGNRAYVAIFDEGVASIDIQHPATLRLLARAPLPGNARGLERVGDYLFVASWKAGVYLLDKNDLHIITYYDTPGAVWGVKAQDEHLYVADWWAGMMTLKINHQTELLAVDQFTHRDKIYDLVKQDNFLYAAQGRAGLQVFEASNRMNPTWAGGISSGITVRQLMPNLSALYGIGSGQALFVYDISNPFETALSAQIYLNGPAKAMRRSGDTLWVSTDLGLTTFDIREPFKPVQQYSMDMPVLDFAVNRQRLVVLAAPHKLQLWDIEEPTQPRLLNETRMSETVKTLDLHQENLWLTLENGEIQRMTFAQTSLSEAVAINGLDKKQTVNALLVDKDRRYTLTSKGVNVYQRRSGDAFWIQQAAFPVMSDITENTHMMLDGDVLYLSGRDSPIAINLNVPHAERLANGKINVTTPKAAPSGEYDLITQFFQTDNKLIVTTEQHKALQVKQRRFSKPQMTMNQFQQLLKQHKEKMAKTGIK